MMMALRSLGFSPHGCLDHHTFFVCARQKVTLPANVKSNTTAASFGISDSFPQV
jgi:hypothetical protein